jgi:hypothetical protein
MRLLKCKCSQSLPHLRGLIVVNQIVAAVDVMMEGGKVYCKGNRVT